MLAHPRLQTLSPGTFQPRANVKLLEPLALDALTLHLAGAAHGLGGLARTALRGLLIMPAELHLPENALALEFLLKRLQRLIDVVITNENLHRGDNS